MQSRIVLLFIFDNLDRYNGSCNALDFLSSKICVSNKTEAINLSVFNMIKEMNELQTLTKHIYHSNVNINFMLENVTRVNSELTINVDVSAKIQENITWVKEIIFGILLHTWTRGNGEYLESLIGDSVIKCDEFIKVAKTTPTKAAPTNTAATKTVPTNLNKEKVTMK